MLRLARLRIYHGAAFTRHFHPTQVTQNRVKVTKWFVLVFGLSPLLATNPSGLKVCGLRVPFGDAGCDGQLKFAYVVTAPPWPSQSYCSISKARTATHVTFWCRGGFFPGSRVAGIVPRPRSSLDPSSQAASLQHLSSPIQC